MKKKILSLLMAATLVVGMTGCVQKPGMKGQIPKMETKVEKAVMNWR